MTLAYSTCVVGQVAARGCPRARPARISRLFSGVRSSCDMFEKNSDLYFDETASCSAFSSTRRLASSTSWFLRSTSMFCSARRLAWLPGPHSSCAALPGAPAAPGLGLGLREQVLGEGVGLDRVEHQPDALGELVEERLVGRAEVAERGELDDRADRAFEQDRQHDDVQRRGLAEARVDPARSRRARRSAGCAPSPCAHWPTRPSPRRNWLARCLRSL